MPKRVVKSPLHTAKIFVGKTRGSGASRRFARCAEAPMEMPTRLIDAMVLAKRGRQVKYLGSTRTKSRGVYQGGGEDSLMYEFIYTPGTKAGGGATGPAAFRKNMIALAGRVAFAFCQDEVWVQYHSPKGSQLIQVKYGADED